MKKKIISFLLVALMFASFTVPALAFDYSVLNTDDGYYFTVNNGAGLKYVLEEYSNSSNPVHIILNNTDIDLEPTVITKGGYIIIEPANREDTFVINYINNQAPLITIEDTEENENTVLFFASKNIEIHGKNNNGDGGAFYVDAEGVIIEGVHCKDCWASYVGGAICINEDDCVVWDSLFENCGAGFRGGAIHFNAGAGDGLVGDCKFYDCKFHGDVNFLAGGDDVLGDYDTLVLNAESNAEASLCIVEVIPQEEWDTYRKAYGMRRESLLPKKEEPLPEFVPEKQLLSAYANNALANNENSEEFCDPIAFYAVNDTASELGHFSFHADKVILTGWQLDGDSSLTITSNDGYKISRIEGVVEYNGDSYKYIMTDNGTEPYVREEYIGAFGHLKDDAVVCIDDINAESVTLNIESSLVTPHSMRFKEFLVYYYPNEELPSADTDSVVSEAPEISPEYTRDGETYDVFTFDKDTYTAGSGNATSELKGFTLTDTAVPARGNIYGWATKITITAPEGYTITRIEGKPVHFESYVEYLKSNAGTIADQGKPLAKDGIVRINDINAGSVEISCTSDYVEFDEFLVFYEKNATLASVFSGGTLWIIIGVAAAAAAAAVVIVVVMKKKKPTTADGAAAEKSEE